MDLQLYLDAAISMARAAGQVHLRHFRSANLSMATKHCNTDVVTVTDRESEALITSMIHSQFPDHGIIAEEGGTDHADAEWRWVVDPLDGTTNFSQGLPVFCCSIALEHRGEPVMGVVYAPRPGELFHAVRGGGAFLNGQRIRCSGKTALADAVLATGVPYDRNTDSDNNLAEIMAVLPHVRAIRRMGSAAIDLCYTAAGFFDAYWELKLHRWDIAAGALIAREAGAQILPLRPTDSPNPATATHSLLAAPPQLLPLLAQILYRQ